MVIYGSTGGPQVPLNAPELFLKNILIMGTTVGNARAFRAMPAFVERHKIHPVIDKRFALDAAKDTLAHLETARQFGKAVSSIQ